MKENLRIKKIFEDAYNGSPWIDVNVVDSISNLTSKQAVKRIFSNRNSIWEIVNHLVGWRRNVLQRVNGRTISTPSHNYFQPVKDISEKAWRNSLLEFSEIQKEWIDFLKSFKQSDFEKTYAPNGLTYYEHLIGILQHDAYHLGQIVLLAKEFE